MCAWSIRKAKTTTHEVSTSTPKGHKNPQEPFVGVQHMIQELEKLLYFLVSESNISLDVIALIYSDYNFENGDR